MKKGTRVNWLVKSNFEIGRGHGVTITDEDSSGTVLVSVDTLTGEPFPGYHQVIHCTVTWLTPE